MVINILEGYDNNITWDIIVKLSSLLETDEYLDCKGYDLFKHYDLYIY